MEVLDAVDELRLTATALRRSGDTTAAVEALEEAGRLTRKAGFDTSCADEIRRAKYLQKEGRAEEAWVLLMALLDTSASPWLDVDILDAMRLHLQRTGEAERAIAYGLAHRVARISLYREMKAEAEAALLGPMPDILKPLGDPSVEKFLDRNATWERMKDNHRFSVQLADQWLTELVDSDDLAIMAQKLSKKARRPDLQAEVLDQIRLAISNGISARDLLMQEEPRYSPGTARVARR